MPYGELKNRTYAAWSGMMQRCHNPHSINYINYGGRGITVIKTWQKFGKFWKDMGRKPEGHFLDRINNLKGYSKSNCRWVTPKKSTENRRNTIWLDGERVFDMAQRIGVKPSLIYQRLYYGFTKQEIESRPLKKNITHCKRGHLLSGENLYVRPGKKYDAGVCKTCQNMHKLEYRKRLCDIKH